MTDSLLEYYRKPGPITMLERHREFTEQLPCDAMALYQITQGLILHDSWVGQYGIGYETQNEYPQITAWMEDLLDHALVLDHRSLAIPRAPEKRVIACCREFATLFCALLRAKGIPARSRCGFAAYFGWGPKYEDHWVTEYWDGSDWVMADPQIDPLQQISLLQWTLNRDDLTTDAVRSAHAFNPRRLRHGDFLTGGTAWQLCRSGAIDPDRFGIGCRIKPEWGIDSLHGLWFARGQLLRDFAALNKVETVPYLVRICKKLDWSAWRLVGARDNELSEDDLIHLDRIAALMANPDGNFRQIRDMYHDREELRPPEEVIKRF